MTGPPQPDNVKATWLSLGIFLMAGLPVQAATIAPEAVPSRAAQIRADLGDYPGAEEILMRALKADPRDAQCLLLLAQVVRDRPQEALGYAVRAAELLAEGSVFRLAASYRLAGEIRLDLEDYAGARASFNRALKLDASDLGALEALVRIERDHPKEALRYAQLAFRAAEDAPIWLRSSAYRVTARIWLELKDDAKAAVSFKRLLEMDQDDVMALDSLVNLRRQNPALRSSLLSAVAGDEGRIDDQPWTMWTQESLQDAKENNPDGLETLRMLIAQASEQGHQQEAAAQAARFAATIEDTSRWQHAAAYRLSARIWLALGDEDKARESKIKATWAQPDGLRERQFLTLDTLTLAQNQGQEKLRIRRNIVQSEASLLEHVAHRWHELGDDVRADAILKRAIGMLEDHIRSSASSSGIFSLAERIEDHRTLARFRLKHKDPDGAEKNLAQLLLLAPNNTEALLLRARIELGRGQQGKAKVYSEQAAAVIETEEASWRPTLYREASQIHLDLKDAVGAENDLVRLLMLVPGDVQALQTLAQLELERGRPTKALTYAHRLIAALGQALPAQRAAAYRLNAQISRVLEDDAGAKRVLLRALALSPKDSKTLQMLVQLEIDGGRPREALAYAERLDGSLDKAASGERAEAERQGALLRLQLNDDGGAERGLLRALKLSPDDHRTLQLLARVMLRGGRPTEARAYASRLTSTLENASPAERIEAYRQSSWVHLELKDTAGAQSDLLRLLQLVPGDPHALQTLAQIELDGGHPKEALAYADRLAGALDHVSAEERVATYRQRAKIRRELKDEVGAETDLQRALESAPGDREILRMLAQGKLRRGQPHEALAYADRLAAALDHASSAERSVIHHLRARIRLELGDAAGAERDLVLALELAPGDFEVMKSLVQAKHKQPQESAALLAKYWPADPKPRARWLALRGLTRTWTRDLAGARRDFETANRIAASSFCSDELFQTDRDSLDTIYFEVCLKRSPKDPALYADRGVARYRAGKKEDAEADFRQAIALKADYLEASLSLVVLLVEQGRKQAALEAVDRALENAADRQSGLHERLLSLQASLRAPGAKPSH